MILGLAEMTHEVQAAVDRGPRLEVIHRGHPAKDTRAVGGRADTARRGVLLRVTERIRDARLDGERRGALARDLRSGLAEAGTLLRIGEEIEHRAREGGVGLALVALA